MTPRNFLLRAVIVVVVICPLSFSSLSSRFSDCLPSLDRHLNESFLSHSLKFVCAGISDTIKSLSLKLMALCVVVASFWSYLYIQNLETLAPQSNNDRVVLLFVFYFPVDQPIGGPVADYSACKLRVTSGYCTVVKPWFVGKLLSAECLRHSPSHTEQRKIRTKVFATDIRNWNNWRRFIASTQGSRRGTI